MVDQIAYDSTHAHEAIPHGVPSQFAWQSQPSAPNPVPPEGWVAAVPWGDVYVDKCAATTAPNTRVEIGRVEIQILSVSTGEWTVTEWVSQIGSWYPEDFQGSPITGDSREEASGTISVTAGNGYTFHFFPSNRIAVDGADVGGVVVVMWARLIPDDPEQPDDRDSARYLVGAGGDWWIDKTAMPDGSNNLGMGTGRFKYVTNEWRAFYFTTLSEEELRANPPVESESP